MELGHPTEVIARACRAEICEPDANSLSHLAMNDPFGVKMVARRQEVSAASRAIGVLLTVKLGLRRPPWDLF